MRDAFICDGVRTPIGRYGGALAQMRADDLAAWPLQALMARHPRLDWAQVDDVLYGAANQSGEDNRNVARMALLLAGLPETIPGASVNRLCGSGLEALAQAARAIKTGEAELMIAGGAESMTRAPFVMAKAASAFARGPEIFDTTLGWRFINPALQARYGSHTMPETAENVAAEFQISRSDCDAFALRSQQRALAAQASGRFAAEIAPVTIPGKKGAAFVVEQDEHPRPTSLEVLAGLKPIVQADGVVTAGNSSGINDGAAAMILASEAGAARQGLTPRARVIAAACAGVAPRIMGMGPAPAVQKLLAKTKMALGQIDIIELNEAFAAQALAVLRQLGLPDDAAHVNPHGGAIALGHPLGMSGARLAITATEELQRSGARYAICTMCIGVGQGIALLIERV